MESAIIVNRSEEQRYCKFKLDIVYALTLLFDSVKL